MTHDRAADERAIADLIQRLSDAWLRGDAEAYGDLFTPDASYTTFVGTQYQGREDIVRSHRALFAKFLKGTQLLGEIDPIRFYGSDTAVVTGRGDTYKRKPPASPTKVQTFVAVREAGTSWRIAAFHNTQREKLKEAVSFRFAPETRPTAAQ